MSGASGSGTGSDSISVRTTSREATPISDAESASSSMIAGQTNSLGFGGPLDPWNPYQWTWNPMLAMQQWQHQICQQQPHHFPYMGMAVPTGTNGPADAPVDAPLRGKRHRDAPSKKGKNPAPKRARVSIPLRGKRPRDAPSEKGKNPAHKRSRMAQDEVVSSASDQNSESESEEDDEGDLAESFDPVSFYNKSSSTPLPEGMGSYVKSHFRKCLTSSIRKSMAKDDPLLDHPSLKCLQADDSIVDFLGRDFPTKSDNQLKRVQSAILATAAPPLNMWRDLQEQGFTNSSHAAIPVHTVLESIQKSLVLTGNASNYVSLIRRDHIISKMESKNKNLAKVMKSICKHHQPDDTLLFGSDVHKALNQRAETASSLRKVATKFSENIQKAPASGRRSNFFRGGLVSDRDRRPGKTFRSQKPQYRSRFNKQKPIQPRNNYAKNNYAKNQD